MTPSPHPVSQVSNERLAHLAKWSVYHCIPYGVITPTDSFLEDPEEIHAILTELLSRRSLDTAVSVDEIEAIILATEPDVPASVDGSTIWTKRMAVALHIAIASRPSRNEGWVTTEDDGVSEKLSLAITEPERAVFISRAFDPMTSHLFEPSASPPEQEAVTDAWRTMDSAPLDGTVILGVTDEAQRPSPRVTWFESGKWMATGKPENFVVQPHGWWPTHWQPMPSFPASSPVTAWLSTDDAETSLFQAIWDIKIGNKTDDKLILENLRKSGVWLARTALQSSKKD